MFIVIIVLYGAISLYEIIPMYKNKKIKEVYVYSFLMIIALAISIIASFGIDIPSPARGIEAIVNIILE